MTGKPDTSAPGKTAVVLLNLGGPDSTAAIEPYLRNFFTDPNIFGLPAGFRHALAWLVARRRSRGEALDAYAKLGGKSPLLDNTCEQAAALQDILGDAFKVFVSMRYWHPMSAEVVEDIKLYNPDRIVLLPLYPQYSTTTTNSSFQDFGRSLDAAGIYVPVTALCCWPLDAGFISASAANVMEALGRARGEHPDVRFRVLFSAHGLPEKIVASGDPYQWQCEQGAQAIAAELGLGADDWRICYQSRVGPLKWIGPSTEEALRKAADDNVGVIVYPHAFVSEHVETLVEIEEEYRDMAETFGVPAFYRAPTVSTHRTFIDALAGMVTRAVDRRGVCTDDGARICPKEFSRCCQEQTYVGISE